jgi:uncharacterized protein (DUF1330 family)
MAGYVIANYRVTDAAGYARYVDAVGATTAAHGAEVLVADFDSEVMEGTPQAVTIVARFASKAAASVWYHSAEYQAIVHLRKDHTQGFLVVVDGV